MFCGCGGLSKGFVDIGYNILLGIDNDEIALQTFKLNHKNAKTINFDLYKNPKKEIQKNIGKKKIDVIIAGPPCQGFSLTGPRKFDDKRNRLYNVVIETVGEFKPRVFLVENVIGLVSMYDGVIKDEIVKRFSRLGYEVNMKILCAADYGVPQVRKRVFFVGVREGLGDFVFPQPTFKPEDYITCKEAIGDLPSRKKKIGIEEDKYLSLPRTSYQKKMRGRQKVLFNHVATVHTEKVKKVITLVPEGGNYKDLPVGVGRHRKFNEAWTRYHSMRPSKTVDTGHRNHFHYKHDRVPTVRENARLQSFPDDFRFLGSRTSQNRQVGNAVPPRLAYYIAREMLKYV